MEIRIKNRKVKKEDLVYHKMKNGDNIEIFINIKARAEIID